ncbi:MAG: hypothetical protein K5Q00_01575, partial [Gammaproteobacteria bacterium]|nr:hypothetical protein [Gammaproteobacteria bacterium]
MFDAQSFDIQRLYSDRDSASTLKQFLVNRHYADKSHDAQVGGVSALSVAQREEIDRSFTAIMGMLNPSTGQIERYALYFQRDRAHVAESVVVAAHQAIVAMAMPDSSNVVLIPPGFSACELTAAVTAAICDVLPSPALQPRNLVEYTALLDRLKRLINSNRQQFQVLLEQKFKEIKGYDTNTDYVEPLAEKQLLELSLQSQKTLFFTLYKLITNYVFEKFNLPKEYYAFKNYDDRYQRGDVAYSSAGSQPLQSSGHGGSSLAPSRGDVALSIEYSPAPPPEQVPVSTVTTGANPTSWCSWRAWLISSLATVFAGCAGYTGWSTNKSLEALLNFLTDAASYGAELPSKWELFLQAHGRALFSDPNDQGNLEMTVGRLVAFITAVGLGATAIGFGCKKLYDYIQQKRRHAEYTPIPSSVPMQQPLSTGGRRTFEGD